jgi:hypothetical protein
MSFSEAAFEGVTEMISSLQKTITYDMLCWKNSIFNEKKKIFGFH